MLRKFSWATNILFPEDLVKKEIPTSVLLSEFDEIVPSSAIERTFRNLKCKKKQMERNIVDCQVVRGARHGDMVLNPEMASITISTVMHRMKQGVAEENWSRSARIMDENVLNCKDLRWGLSTAPDGALEQMTM
jgi:hypothetical protein